MKAEGRAGKGDRRGGGQRDKVGVAEGQGDGRHPKDGGKWILQTVCMLVTE